MALVTLGAVNAILITWATVLDTRHPSALIRALGATPGQVSTGLSAARALPALAGALLGVPGGIELFAVIRKDGAVTVPPAWLADRDGSRHGRRGRCRHHRPLPVRRPPYHGRDPSVRGRVIG